VFAVIKSNNIDGSLERP